MHTAAVIAVGHSEGKFILMGPYIAFIPCTKVILFMGTESMITVSFPQDHICWVFTWSTNIFIVCVYSEISISEHTYTFSQNSLSSVFLFFSPTKLTIQRRKLFPTQHVCLLPVLSHYRLSGQPRIYLKFCHWEDFPSVLFFRVTFTGAIVFQLSSTFEDYLYIMKTLSQ